MPYEQLGQWSFSRPGSEQRYATMQFPIIDGERMRAKLPADAFDIHLVVYGAIDARREWDHDPSAFPDGKPVGPHFVLSEKGCEEVREIARAAWLEAGGDPVKFDVMHQAAMRALQANSRRTGGASQFAPALEEPADYDDSELALGKQRIAQIERMRESDNRKFDLSDV